jgi:hypothetical protein
MDKELLVVAVTDARLGTLLGSAHLTMPRADWEALSRAGDLGPPLSARVERLGAEALRRAAARTSPPADALHVGFDLARDVTRADEGDSLCVTALLEEALAPTYTVVRTLGGDRLATARRVLGQPAELRRPTRRFVLNWQNAPERAPRRTLPVELRLDAAIAESVLGQHVPAAYHATWRFADGPNATVAFTPDPAFVELLDAERRTLALADWPQVAKIDRAWVYVDRGRAWGLRMGDRLVGTVDGEPVKAHVVRFYGPELKIKSPRGFDVREGAVLYVRKGQRRARLGLEFRMDPRTFPTPYPIPPGTP